MINFIILTDLFLYFIIKLIIHLFIFIILLRIFPHLTFN